MQLTPPLHHFKAVGREVGQDFRELGDFFSSPSRFSLKKKKTIALYDVLFESNLKPLRMPIGPDMARDVEDNHIPTSSPHGAGDGTGRRTSQWTCVFPVPGLWTANHPTPCFLASPCCQCPLLLYFITLNSGEGRCSTETCVRSVLSLLKLGVSPMYHDSVLYSVSLLKNISKYIIRGKHNDKRRTGGKASHCNFFFSDTTAPIEHPY